MWEPRRLTTLRASTVRYSDSFTFFNAHFQRSISAFGQTNWPWYMKNCTRNSATIPMEQDGPGDNTCHLYSGILVRIRTILTEIFRRRPQSLQANVGAVPQVRPRLISSTFFPIHYSLIKLPFDAMKSGVLTASLNKL
jgi:hypothetical protein